MAHFFRGLKEVTSSVSRSIKDHDHDPKFAMDAVLTKPFTTINAYLDFWKNLDSASATSFFAGLAAKVMAAERARGTGKKEAAEPEIALGALRLAPCAHAEPSRTRARPPRAPTRTVPTTGERRVSSPP